jgi:hypothetical protein
MFVLSRRCLLMQRPATTPFRVQGRPFARIAQELNVSETTLIAWSRKHQHAIANLAAIERENRLADSTLGADWPGIRGRPGAHGDRLPGSEMR